MAQPGLTQAGRATDGQGARGSVTLADVARAAGVSRSTVSLVLRGSPLVRADTRARVEAELDRQQYVYNRAAAALRQRTSSSVALVINDLSNPFFAEFAAGVAEALGEAGYVTLLGSTGESPRRQQAVLVSLLEHAPAGLILSPAEGSEPAGLRAALGRMRNVLLFNREVEGMPGDLLALDNEAGARLATRHLVELGYRRIAFFGDHASSACRQRRTGYRRAMRAARLPARVVAAPPVRQEATAAALRLFENLAAADRPDAVVCYNDSVALGLMAGLAVHGLRAGTDVAITGFDDIAEAALATPTLTTIAADPRLRGREAAGLLLQRLQVPDAPPRRVTAAVALRVRASSGASFSHAPGATGAQVSLSLQSLAR
ncbi:MAG: LacI family DNA-binding transcriptional regulator [Pseudomonas sp.]